MGGVPKWGCPFWGLFSKDSTILEAIITVPRFGELPMSVQVGLGFRDTAAKFQLWVLLKLGCPVI